MTKDCIVICSGGLDSTVLLYWVINQGYKPTVLTFDYGQRHKKEIEYVKKTTQKLKLAHQIIKLPEIFKGSALTSSNIEVPKEQPTHESQKMTIVPNRNMIMLSIAAGLAESIKTSTVFYGVHASDYAIYWDCRPNFLININNTLSINDLYPITIEAPFIGMTKIQLVTEGLDLQVPFEDTWTCYEGKEVSCRECGSCRERIDAFQKNAVIDPIPYNIKVDWSNCKEIKY